MESSFSQNTESLKPEAWQKEADRYLIQKNYLQAASLYEQAIEREPNNKSYYWHLGLMLLLEGQEAEAQTTWLLAMAQGGEEQVALWTEELLDVLQAEAERQRLEVKDYGIAWAIRQHIREINPADINNLLHSIGLSTLLGTYTGEELKELGVIDMLNSEAVTAVDSELLMEVWKNVLDCAPWHKSSLEFTEACLPHIKELMPFLVSLAGLVFELALLENKPQAVRLGELGLRLAPNEPELLKLLSHLYQDIGEFDRGIEAAQLCYELVKNLVDRVYANHMVIRGLMSKGCYGEQLSSAWERHKLLIDSLLKEQPANLYASSNVSLFNVTFFLPYIQDLPRENAEMRNQISKLCQLNIETYARKKVERYRQRKLPLLKANNDANKHLKIGFLSSCLRRHSVGWLARGIFQHYDRDRFEFNAYLLSHERLNDSIQEWYISKASKAYKLGLDSIKIADLIYEDEIDILIDLDSITMTHSCEVMAMKPAPIQVSWLGWDASGIPAIDYYIADPYVLPESAQEYYSEKIWRLPQTYIAVDGFEEGIPTLRREDIDIPSNGIIYFSGQRGYKYNPQTIGLQMKIIKAVPNSYFLFKGYSDRESLKTFFIEMAKAEGVSCDRLRFLPLVGAEAVHRVNLGIVDIVLDTYPYNGATTTLETLWMGIPLVTRVGQQFSARNSYTMMMNAGVTEGIAWTDDEYVEWGIRLGKDSALRQQITWKLQQARKTSDLWNAEKFTRQMEQAFEQMWQKYVGDYC